MLFAASQLLFLALLLFCFWAAGGVLLRIPLLAARFDGEDRLRTRATEILTRFAFGWILTTGALFVLASAGLYLAPAIVFSLLALAAVGLAVAPKRQRPAQEGSQPSPDTAVGRWSVIVMVVPLAIWVVAFVLEALEPTISWDADVYHLTIPKLYLQAGGFYRIPFNVYSNWPLSLELLYGVGLLSSPQLAKLLHLSLGLGAAVTAGLLATEPDQSSNSGVSRGTSAAFASVLAALLFVANPVVSYQIATAYVDCGYAFFFALAALWLVHKHDTTTGPSTSSQVIAGVLTGMVAAIKLNGFFAALTLGVVAALTLARRPATRLRCLAILGTVSFALLLPWLIKTAVLTGNPVYPLLYEQFGGPEWSVELARKHSQWMQSVGMGRDPIDYLLLPIRVILEGGEGYAHFDGRVQAWWIVLLPLTIAGALLSTFRDRLTSLYLMIAALYFLLWAATSQQTRFLIPILPFLSAAAARTVVRLLVALAARGPGAARFTSAVAAALAVIGGAQLLHQDRTQLFSAPGFVEQLSKHGRELDQRVIHPIYRVIDQLPADAKVLMFNHNQGFYMSRPYLADSFFEASQIEAMLSPQTTEKEVLTTLYEHGITHFLVANRDMGLRFSESLVSLLANPEQVRLLHRSDDERFLLYQIRPQSAPVAPEPAPPE